MLYTRLLLVLVLCLLVFAGACGTVEPCSEQDSCNIGSSVPTGSAVLSITPIAQQTEVWCWAATAEMVLRHVRVPSVNFYNYQCGIVAAYFGGDCAVNCGLCVRPINGMAELDRLLRRYGPFATQLGFPSPTVTTRLQFRSLSFREVVAEIDAGRPVAAGISAGSFPFPNFSNHVVVIVGYDARGAEPYLYVNDPFPYNLPQFVLQGVQNPYFLVGATEVQPGRYRISYSAFVGPMAWGNSIDRIVAQ